MEKEANCINSKAIIDYIKSQNKGDCSLILGNLHPEIDSVTDPEKYLSDPNNWISCSVLSKLWERGRLFSQDDLFAYKVAQYAVENTSLGYVQKIIVKAFWSHRKALNSAQEINDKLNRSKRVRILHISPRRSIIRLYWDHSMELIRDMCLMNQGIYTFLPTVWGGSPLILEEKCCFFNGAPYCEYHLRWPTRNKFKEFVSRFFTSKSVLMETIEEMEADKKIIERKYEEVNKLNIELERKISQIMAIQETGKAILTVLDLNKLLSIIMNLLSTVCRIDRAIIMLLNEKTNSLEYIHGITSNGEIPQEIRDYKVPMSHINNILVRVANSGKPEYIPEIVQSNLKKENVILVHGKPTAAYVVPLITRAKSIGVIATDAVGGSGVPIETRESLDLFAPQIAITIENARLYSELEEQMRKLKRSHSLLSRAERFSFLGHLAARLAHEIKNPLTAIETFLQMFPRKYNDEKFRNDFYKIAVEETNRVNRLITELLDLVKKKESCFEFGDLHSLIDRMVLLISPQSKNKNILVIKKYDSNMKPVKMDPEKMKQTILNLLINAVEFTPEGGKIEIVTTIRNKGEESDAINIEINDTGVGIPEPMLEKIFDPYHTTKHKSDLHSGTGLGLFIAHQNMEDHGGTIDVKSKINVGTSFILTLPYGSSTENPQ